MRSTGLRISRLSAAVLIVSLNGLGCSSDDDAAAATGNDAGASGGSGGAGGAGAAGGTGGGSGATGGAGGGAGAGAAGGAGGGAGASGAGGSGGSAGDGGPGCGAINTFADGAALQRELHVDPALGNDTLDGSAENPLRTITAAASRAEPGTAIRLHAGTYPGGAYIANLRGRADAPIWIGGIAGESRPVFNGGGEAIHLTRPQYVVIHDLEVRSTTANGINIDDGSDYGNPDAASYVVVRNVSIQDVGGTGNQDCLKLSGLNQFWILDSSFARCGGAGSGSGIDMVGCHDGTIARSRFDEMSGNAVQAKGASADVDILANLFTNAGLRALNMGGSTGFEFFRPPLDVAVPAYEARRIRAAANVIIGSQAAVAFVGCVDCSAHNNTIVDPTRWVLRILQETSSSGGYTFLPASNSTFYNNLIYFTRSQLAAFANVGANTDGPSFRFFNNLWYAHDDPTRSAPTDLPAAEQDGIAGQDPAFVNAAAGDYTIPSSSPAAGAGAALDRATSDHSGRCYLTPPSIGAFEVP